MTILNERENATAQTRPNEFNKKQRDQNKRRGREYCRRRLSRLLIRQGACDISFNQNSTRSHRSSANDASVFEFAAAERELRRISD